MKGPPEHRRLSGPLTGRAGLRAGGPPGGRQARLAFSVTCPLDQRGDVLASADQGGNGTGSSTTVTCTGSAQTVQVQAGTSGDGYGTGPAYIGGALYLDVVPEGQQPEAGPGERHL